MKSLLLILQLFPVMLAGVRALEETIPLPQSGKQKLDLVLDVVKTAYESSAELQKEFAWDKLAGVVVTIVGKIVGTLNALGVFKKSAA
jgi:hypothetical protein